jgi:hypothetical protein
LLPASAHAAVGADTSVKLPTGSVVGALGLPASITLPNLNTDFEELQTQRRLRSGRGRPAVRDARAGHRPGARLQAGGGRPLLHAGGRRSRRLRRLADGRGRLGSACAGMTFTTAVADPAFGTVGFAPPAGARVVLQPGASCQIDFTVDVLKLPTGDLKPATPRRTRSR